LKLALAYKSGFFNLDEFIDVLDPEFSMRLTGSNFFFKSLETTGKFYLSGVLIVGSNSYGLCSPELTFLVTEFYFS
jgi:hypothetical protein